MERADKGWAYLLWGVLPDTWNCLWFNKNAFEFNIALFTGFNRCNYPYYKAIFLHSKTDPHTYWAHDGERPYMENFTAGASFSVQYKLFSRLAIGIEANYHHTNFNYSMKNRTIPGSFTYYPYDDMLKVRVLNTGIKIRYTFWWRGFRIQINIRNDPFGFSIVQY